MTVQDTGAAFGMAPMDARRAWLAGLPALVKTAGQEWPKASLKAVDLERGGREPQALAKALAAELLEGAARRRWRSPRLAAASPSAAWRGPSRRARR